jgi:hypothetical protein
MNRAVARNNLKEIIKNQKSISISRLQKIMIIIDLDSMEQERVHLSKIITKQQKRIADKSKKIQELERKSKK